MSESHQREAAIFDAAMELPPEQRAAHLDHACGGDAALRQRIESLLKACESRCEFLDSPPDPAAAKTMNVLPASFEKAGDRIGRYKLLQQIGEGGCGVVYMAEQEEPVQRRVALKVIKLGLDTKSVIARFEAERQALALMDHPNIAKVLDAGATETGRPYFVMELVRGLKITEYCDEARLSTHARLDLFIQVCQAIQHAHQKGIIHRDIKPSNILVTINDGVPVPKVIDFGIAKATGGLKLTDKTVFTAFEQFIGTPAYMSPEQAVLTSLDIDTRSDIYALGVLLYELLTGRTPFDAKELLAIGLDEMRRTIREQEPPRPSTRLSTLPGQELSTTAQRRGLDAPKLVSELRGDLDWIVMKALEKDRARRYETANGLASDIQRHLNNEPVVACPPSNLYKFEKLVRRNRLAFAAGAGIAAALVIGLAIVLWQSIEKTRAYNRAIAAENAAQFEAAKSQQVATFLQEMLRSVGPSVAAGRDTEMLRDILDKADERVGRELTNQPAVEAELRNTVGFAYWELGEYDKAEQMYRQSLELLRKISGNKSAAVAKTLHNLADLLRRTAWSASTSPYGAKTLHNLADLLRLTPKLDEAEANEREALEIYEKLYGREHQTVGDVLHNLAGVLSIQGKLDEAEAAARESLAINQKLFDAEHSNVGVCLGQLGIVLVKQGELVEAESVLDGAERILRKALGKPHGSWSGLNPHVELGWALHVKARLLGRQEKWAEAETTHREALALLRKVQGNVHPDVVAVTAFLADNLAAQGKLTEAESLLIFNYENLRHHLDKTVNDVDKVSLAQAMQRLTQFYETTGRPDRAAEWKQKLAEFERAHAHRKADAR